MTSTRSPSRSRAWGMSASHAVQNASGKPAASSNDTLSGMAITIPSGTATCSAWPPPPSRAMTLWPGSNALQVSPSCSTVPATSSPGV